MRREKKLLVNSIILGIGSVLPRISTFITLPILTTALTKTEYGQYDLILTSMSLILPIFSLFIEEGVFRFLLESEFNDYRRKIITNSSIYIIISSIVLFGISLLVLNRLGTGNRLLLSLFLVVDLYYRYMLQVTRGLCLIKDFSLSGIIRSILNLMFIVAFVGINRSGFLGLLMSLTLSCSISTIFLIYKCKIIEYISFEDRNFNYLWKLLKYSIPLIPNSISWWIVSVSDRWIITAILGVEMNAIYAISNKIPSLVSVVLNNFNLAWQESASISYKDEDVSAYYTNIFKYLFDFLAGTLVLLITLSPLIFKMLIDESYFSAYYQMPILFLAMFFSSLSSFYGGIYIALKRTKEIALTSFLSAGLNFIINILLISKIGLYAASLSTLIAYLILTMSRALAINKEIAIKYNYKKIILMLLAIVIISVINYINSLYLNLINFIFAIIMAIWLNKILINKVLIKLGEIISK